MQKQKEHLMELSTFSPYAASMWLAAIIRNAATKLANITKNMPIDYTDYQTFLNKMTKMVSIVVII